MVHQEVRKYKIKYGRNWIRTSDPLLVRELLRGFLPSLALCLYLRQSTNNAPRPVEMRADQTQIMQLALILAFSEAI